MVKGRVRFQPRAAGAPAAKAGLWVVTAVSSIKTSRCGSRRSLGIRRWRHSYRAARTRLRHRSVAISDFFYVNPSRCRTKRGDSSASAARIPCACHKASASSGMIMSGVCPIRAFTKVPDRSSRSLPAGRPRLAGATVPNYPKRCRMPTALAADIWNRRAA